MTFNEIILNPLDATADDLTEHWPQLSPNQRETIQLAILARSAAGEGELTLSANEFLAGYWNASFADVREYWDLLSPSQRNVALRSTWANAAEPSSSSSSSSSEESSSSSEEPSSSEEIVLATQWRMLVTANKIGGTLCGVSQVVFRQGPNDPLNQNTGGTASASTEVEGYLAENAFDGDHSNTLWYGTLEEDYNWIQYTFPEPVNVHSVRVRASPTLYNSNYTPKDGMIQYYDEDTEDWVTWISFENVTNWVGPTEYTFVK